MAENKACFIMTKDKESADKLAALGYKEIKNGNGVYTFLNDPKLNFSNQETKVVYSDKLCF